MKRKMNVERLLNVARALRESEHPEFFDMRYYVHSAAAYIERFVEGRR